MTRFRATAEIAASAGHVWPVVFDVEHWPDWTPTVTSIERLDPGSLRVGSRARVRQPRLPTAVWTVSAVEDGRSFEWHNRSPGLHSVANHIVEPLGDDRSRVTLTLDWTGPLVPVLRLIYGGLARNYVDTEAASLKRYCESGGPAGAA